MMKAVKYLIAPWIGIVVYTITTILWGPRGLGAYDQLLADKAVLQANMLKLQRLNKELDTTQEALRLDRDLLVLRARDLGYAPAGERFVRIVGLSGSQQPRLDSGQVLYSGKPKYIPGGMLCIISFSIGGAVFIALGLWDFLRFCRNRTERFYSNEF